MKPIARLAAGIAGAILLATPAHADSIDDSLFAPEEKCGYCHGIDGNSAMGRFPRLGGQRFEYLMKQLQDFRAGRRRNDDGVMATNAEVLAEADVARVARYFSEQAPRVGEPPPAASPGATLYWKGRGAVAACIQCHGASVGARKGPLLAGQHAAYIEKQLRDWRNGTRANDPAHVMPAIARALTDQDIAALAAYLAAASPRAATTAP